jgi:molecular chaperone GrpE
MTEREMLNTLERVGIKPIEALGQRYDHNLHEAMFDVEDATQPAGMIIQVLERGYMLGERLLRPAKVGVAKGGSSVAEETQPTQPTATADEEAPQPSAQSAAAHEKRPKADGPAGSKLDEKL